MPEDKVIHSYSFAKKLRKQVETNQALCDTYEVLIKTVIAPHLLSQIEDDTILYQFPPTLRINPSVDEEKGWTKVMGRLHSDNEFGH